MSTLKFADTYNLVAFLEKPEESNGATTKVKTVNEERQLQALVDKKKVIITKTSIISDLKLEDAGGTNCLPTATIFEELARMGRKQRKDSAPIEPTAEETPDETHVSTPSYDPSHSSEDRMQLHELMNLCTKLSDRVISLETTKSNQALEIESLKRREDASKQGLKIDDLDVDAEVTLVDETQEMNDDNLMFDTGVLEEQEKDVTEKEVSAADPVTTAGETLIEIKAAKPKVVTSAATKTTTTRPKAIGVVVQEPNEFKTTSSSLQESQLPHAKDKGKGIMVKPEVPLKKKDQVALDEEMARNL
ncbi:hypothetical protein Tco_1286360 [Tanacetum coccineum]